MDAPLDLYNASRADLIDLLLSERDRRTDLERRLGQQELELAAQRAAIGHLTERLGEGTRSAAGSATKMTLATRFGTWRVQDLNPLDHCRQLLANPQV